MTRKTNTSEEETHGFCMLISTTVLRTCCHKINLTLTETEKSSRTTLKLEIADKKKKNIET